MPKGDGLTPKQRKLVKAKAEGKTTRQAAKEAKMHESYACNLLKEPQIKATIQQLMDKAGLSDSTLLAKHVELLNAQKTVSAVSGKDAGSDTVDFVDVPDYQTQKSALEMAYKLKGAFVEKKEVTFPEGLTLNVSFRGTDGDNKR